MHSRFLGVRRKHRQATLVRIVLSIILVLSSLGIGKDTNSLLKGLVASLLERLGRRLEAVRGLLVQRHGELGSRLLAVD